MWVEEDSDQYTIFINADNAAGLKINAKRGHINPGSEVLWDIDDKFIVYYEKFKYFNIFTWET